MAPKIPKQSPIHYEIEVEEDAMPVRGNAMASGDPLLDRKVENEILRRLGSGDLWAWCVITVKASAIIPGVQPVWQGTAHLGGCSYKDEAEFKAGAYYEDMKKEAFENLLYQLNEAVKRSQEAQQVRDHIEALVGSPGMERRRRPPGPRMV